MLEEAINDVSDRAKSRTVETPEDEQMLINWYRTLATLSGKYRMLQKDTDIDEMQEEMDILKESNNERSQR